MKNIYAAVSVTKPLAVITAAIFFIFFMCRKMKLYIIFVYIAIFENVIQPFFQNVAPCRPRKINFGWGICSNFCNTWSRKTRCRLVISRREQLLIQFAWHSVPPRSQYIPRRLTRSLYVCIWLTFCAGDIRGLSPVLATEIPVGAFKDPQAKDLCRPPLDTIIAKKCNKGFCKIYCIIANLNKNTPYCTILFVEKTAGKCEDRSFSVSNSTIYISQLI